MKNHNSIYSVWVLAALLGMIIFSGCAPRGETKTLDEILARAKERFSENIARLEGLQPPVSEALQLTAKNLDMAMSSDRPNSDLVVSISDNLLELSAHAGIPSRAALGELRSQYRELGHTAYTPDQLRLLAARTLTLLSSELETTRFKS
jgi:hypothetical protein